jgi:uncharacterized protein (DUF1810 family)
MAEFNLSRFIGAQNHGSYESALRELKNGRKVGHWMWFIFPQIKGLGHSSTSVYYSIQNLDEAIAYLSDPVLGERIIQCTEALLSLPSYSAEEIFGYPDYLKFLSSLTLFEQASGKGSIFTEALEKYYPGQRDQKTLEILQHVESGVAS